MHRAIGQRRLGAQQVIARKFTLRLADPQSGGGIALRIEIDAQRTPAGRRECGGQIDRGRRLAYPALLVRDRDPDHDYPRFLGTIRPPNRPAPTNTRLPASVRLCSPWNNLFTARVSHASTLTPL